MVRWEPGAAGRLREAAMELYVERGFEQTTVAEIAQRAGVTARTFFRHFADKREVLFAGSEDLAGALMRAIVEAPAGAGPMAVVAAALDVGGGLLGQDRERSRHRQLIIRANPELQERELIKLARLGDRLAEGLRARGIAPREAVLAAEAGILVLRVAFESWVSGTDQGDLRVIMAETLAALRTVTA
ncbi:TetR family transcriptional regulator [Actinoplanes cyaneus]|uniref:TetR family transcriptional regulator n=1 Tax=Actinoplanes cyaneus TaxID=52696 RepID=A0A919M3V1_9ACTN|nr:TetR family transcriptional regulator [Actinoplanes cyaneus]MCW2137513.1 transcriptional regulator, TetR family [Actinoplanes cyaneus]GID63563.1 TetR family transcriptional regulator [Actinoplanes cyaneus]